MEVYFFVVPLVGLMEGYAPVYFDLVLNGGDSPRSKVESSKTDHADVQARNHFLG